jgi:hypothetical protein
MLPVLMILAMLAGETPSVVSIVATPGPVEANGTVEVAIEVDVTDDTDPAPLVRLFRVTADDPLADGDAEITGTHTVTLALPDGEERVYTLHVEAIDRDGNRGVGTAEVTVRAH